MFLCVHVQFITFCVQDAAQALGLAPVADEGAMMPMNGLHSDGLRKVDANETWDTRLTRVEVAHLLLSFPIPSVYSAAEDLVTEYLAGIALCSSILQNPQLCLLGRTI